MRPPGVQPRHKARRSGVHLCAEFEFGGTLMRSTPLGVYLCAQVRRQGYTYANPSLAGPNRKPALTGFKKDPKVVFCDQDPT